MVKKRLGILDNYRMNYLTEFNLYIDNVLILYILIRKRKELPKLCYHPGWRLMRLGYRTCFHTFYDEKKLDIVLILYILSEKSYRNCVITLVGG